MSDDNKFGGWLAFTLYIGAALYDGDDYQRTRLRRHIRPKLQGVRDGSVSPAEILEEVTDIMGHQWRPTGEWKQWIDALIGKGGS